MTRVWKGKYKMTNLQFRAKQEAIAEKVQRKHLHASVDATLFTWLPRERKFVSEFSTVFGPQSQVPTEVAIRNPKTNGVALFKWFGTDKDNEGETLCWRYANEEHKLTAVIYND